MKGHIRERSAGHWAIVVDVDNPTTGKRRRKWHSFRGTKREAQHECARLVHEVQTRTYVEVTRETVAQFLERWLRDVKPTISPKTYYRYAQLVRRNIVPLLGGIVLAKLRPEQVTAAYAMAQAHGTVRGPLSPRTIGHMHRTLKQAIGATRWARIHRASEDRPVKPPRVEKPALVTYGAPEVAALLDALRGERLYMPALLAVLCGLRRGEVVALRWGDIDLAACQFESSGPRSRWQAPSVSRLRSRGSRAP